jgi:hypothetical protein
VYFFIFETRGRTLENVNELFDKNNVLGDTLDMGRRTLQAAALLRRIPQWSLESTATPLLPMEKRLVNSTVCNDDKWDFVVDFVYKLSS